jgi:ribonuclease HI
MKLRELANEMNSHIKIVWVPRHTRIIGIEKADKLDREVTEKKKGAEISLKCLRQSSNKRIY